MIVSQPHSKQLGIQLIESIESGKYHQITIMVAYAKLSGVYRVLPYIEKFRNNGGEVRVVVGIDQQHTTYDALQQLMKCADNLFVFHSENITQTFHIKCYWLKGDNTCWYAIGSNNLTAGGLFSNYELSTICETTGNDALKTNSDLEAIYSVYTNPASSCTHKVDNPFLEQLLQENYIVRELQQRKALIEIAKKTQDRHPKTRLFGNEAFSAPALPAEYRTEKSSKSEISHSVEQETIIQEPQRATSTVSADSNNYLIRLIPRAGNRSKQVHFTIDLLEKYFCLSPGDMLLVQEMFTNGNVGSIEQRQVVFSQRNKNVKVELAGAAILDTNYPSNPDTRPILILKRVNDNLFVYMIIMNGDDGYTAINQRLKNLPAGRFLVSVKCSGV